MGNVRSNKFIGRGSIFVSESPFIKVRGTEEAKLRKQKCPKKYIALFIHGRAK